MLALSQRGGGGGDVTSPTFGNDPSPAWCRIGSGSAHATSLKSEPRINMENAIHSVHSGEKRKERDGPEVVGLYSSKPPVSPPVPGFSARGPGHYPAKTPRDVNSDKKLRTSITKFQPIQSGALYKEDDGGFQNSDSSFVSPYGVGSPSPSLPTTAMSPVILAPENDMRCSGTPVWLTSGTPVCSSATPVGQPGSCGSGDKVGFAQQPLSAYNNAGPEQSPFELCCITPTHSLFSSSVEKKAAARRRGASNASITSRVRNAGCPGSGDLGGDGKSRSARADRLLPHTTSSGRVVRRRGGGMLVGMGRSDRAGREWGGLDTSDRGGQESGQQQYHQDHHSQYHLHHSDDVPADGGEYGNQRGRGLNDANARMLSGAHAHSARQSSSVHKNAAAQAQGHQHGNVAAAAAAAAAAVANYSLHGNEAHNGRHARRQYEALPALSDLQHPSGMQYHGHGSTRGQQYGSSNGMGSGVGSAGGREVGAATAADKTPIVLQDRSTTGEKDRRAASRYKGVTWDRVKRMWRVRLCLQGGARQHIGYYLDEEAGAVAYVQALNDAKARGLSVKNDGLH